MQHKSRREAGFRVPWGLHGVHHGSALPPWSSPCAGDIGPGSTARTWYSEGDTLQGSNYKITKIENQAIYLTDADGTPYVLRDGKFSDGSAVANAQPKNQSKPKPQTQPQPKQQPQPLPQPNPEKGRTRPKPNLGNPNGNKAEPRNNKPGRQPEAGDAEEDDEDLEW